MNFLDKFTLWKLISLILLNNIVVEWLERRGCNQHGPGSNPTRAILFVFEKDIL